MNIILVVVCKPEPLSDAQLNESSIAVQFFGNEIVNLSTAVYCN